MANRPSDQQVIPGEEPAKTKEETGNTTGEQVPGSVGGVPVDNEKEERTPGNSETGAGRSQSDNSRPSPASRK